MALPQDLEFNWSVTEPGGTIRNDVRLATPELSSPTEGLRVCADTVDLVWDQVSGATHYIVQWCRNSSFSGPTLDGKKVEDSGDATTTATLTIGTATSDDVQRGNVYYWRVMAYDESGGVSEKSEQWWFRAGCVYYRGAGGNSSDADCYDVLLVAELTATKTSLLPGEVTKVSANLSYTETLVDAEWIVEGDGVSILDQSTDESDLWVKLKANDVSATATVTVTLQVTFDIDGDTLVCESHPLVLFVVSPTDSVTFWDCQPGHRTVVQGCAGLCGTTWISYGGMHTYSYYVAVAGAYYYKMYPVIIWPFDPLYVQEGDVVLGEVESEPVFVAMSKITDTDCVDPGSGKKLIIGARFNLPLLKGDPTGYDAGGEYYSKGQFYWNGTKFEPWVPIRYGYTGCVTVYTGFYFDDYYCTLTTDTSTICFEGGILTSIS